MALYPLEICIVRNLGSTLSIAPKAKIIVVNATSGQVKPVYSSPTGDPTSEIEQPFTVEDIGTNRVHTSPGRTRVDAEIDEALTQSYEVVIADDDNISPPVWGEEPQGAVDGANKTFVLSKVPLGGRAALFVDGIMWKQVDLTVNPVGRQFNTEGVVITTGDAPLTGAVVQVNYTPAKV